MDKISILMGISWESRIFSNIVTKMLVEIIYKYDPPKCADLSHFMREPFNYGNGDYFHLYRKLNWVQVVVTSTSFLYWSFLLVRSFFCPICVIEVFYRLFVYTDMYICLCHDHNSM